MADWYWWQYRAHKGHQRQVHGEYCSGDNGIIEGELMLIRQWWYSGDVSLLLAACAFFCCISQNQSPCSSNLVFLRHESTTLQTGLLFPMFDCSVVGYIQICRSSLICLTQHRQVQVLIAQNGHGWSHSWNMRKRRRKTLFHIEVPTMWVN